MRFYALLLLLAVYGCSPNQFQSRRHQKITGYGWHHQKKLNKSHDSNLNESVLNTETVSFSDTVIDFQEPNELVLEDVNSNQDGIIFDDRLASIQANKNSCNTPKTELQKFKNLSSTNVFRPKKQLKFISDQVEERDSNERIPLVSWWALAVAILLIIVAVSLLYSHIAIGYYLIYITLLSILAFVLGLKGLIQRKEGNWPSWVALGASVTGTIFGALVLVLVIFFYLLIGTIIALFTGEWPSLDLGLF